MISLGHKNLTGVDTVQVGERVLSFEALGLSNTPRNHSRIGTD
jgi:hypothetical protein